jgi:TonB family protein
LRLIPPKMRPLLCLLLCALGAICVRAGEGKATKATAPESELPRLVLEPVYNLKDLEKEPVATYQLPAAYPGTLRMQRIEGSVVVAFTVTAKGSVQDPHVVSSTHEGFEQAALNAVKRWRFTPGQKDGKPVAAKVQVSVAFSLGTR